MCDSHFLSHSKHQGLELGKGKEIERMLACIIKSKICVPIFTKVYADSKWCIKELAKAVERNKRIIHVFLDVDLLDSGPSASTYQRHQSKEQLKPENMRK
ncbi:hypothetical protein EJ110_NYTH52548 [Nymphaea thermarum]|nr:hypothetical protein EJ110_NYTH52548 [Nymphaea thermarum]